MKLPKIQSESKSDPLDAASTQIRRYCGWHITPELVETLTLTAFGGKTLFLPSKNVTKLIRVEIDGVDITSDVDLDSAGIITLRNGCFPNRNGSVRVTIKHGFPIDEVADLAALAEQVSARIALAKRQGTDVMWQTAGPFSVRRQARKDGQVGGAGFFDSEKEILDRYRI